MGVRMPQHHVSGIYKKLFLPGPRSPSSTFSIPSCSYPSVSTTKESSMTDSQTLQTHIQATFGSGPPSVCFDLLGRLMPHYIRVDGMLDHRMVCLIDGVPVIIDCEV